MHRQCQWMAHTLKCMHKSTKYRIIESGQPCTCMERITNCFLAHCILANCSGAHILACCRWTVMRCPMLHLILAGARYMQVYCLRLVTQPFHIILHRYWVNREWWLRLSGFVATVSTMAVWRSNSSTALCHNASLLCFSSVFHRIFQLLSDGAKGCEVQSSRKASTGWATQICTERISEFTRRVFLTLWSIFCCTYLCLNIHS